MPAATSVHPEQVLKDLHELWTSYSENRTEPGSVLRACAMTLLVTATEAKEADQVRQTMGVLMHSHPSRAIIVHMGASADEINAHVFSECWKPFGSTQQICAEGIEITPGTGGLEEVARFVVPLRAPDLPLIVWRRGPLGRDNARYEPLLELADKVVFDTFGTPDAAGALTYLRKLQTAGRRVGDLSWTRLTGWREVIAHLFDDAALPLGEIGSVSVTYGGGRLSTSALYIASWIRSALPGTPVIVEAVNAPAQEPAGLLSIEFTTGSDHLALRRTEGDCLEITGAGRNYRTALPPVRIEDLMREELNLLGHDPVYERVLAA